MENPAHGEFQGGRINGGRGKIEGGGVREKNGAKR